MTRAREISRAYEAIVDRFVAWAEAGDTIRGAAVIGSRARKDRLADEWADLDIVIWSTDPARYLEDAAWTGALGDVWITFTEDSPDPRVRERRVLFAGGLDVDFAFVHPGAADGRARSLADVAADVFGRGVRVLLDRDGDVAAVLAAVRPPGRPAAPDVATFAQVVSDFWYHAVWTAKHLRRGELWWAKGSCDGHLKELLRIVLEWDAAAGGRDPWFRGRFLEQWGDPATVRGLSSAFARYDEDELWSALEVTMDLFSRLARRLVDTIALPYPADAEDRARELVREYESTRRPGAS